MLSVALAPAACGSDTEPSGTTGDTEPSGTTGEAEASDTTSPVDPAVGERFDGCPNAPSGSSPAVVDEQSGTYAATITAYLPSAGSITVDVVQWLVGEEAAAAHLAETGETGGPPNDYYVVDADPRLRTLPVAAEVTVLLVALGEDSSADVSVHTDDDLIAAVDAGGTGPFWVTIDGGAVTQICEQYVP